VPRKARVPQAAGGRTDPGPLVTGDTLAGSVHGKKVCTDCHFDVSEIRTGSTPSGWPAPTATFKGTARGRPVRQRPRVFRLGARHGDREGEHEGAAVPGLPRQPRDPQGEGSRVEGRPGAGRRDVRQVPTWRSTPSSRVDPRGGAREGDREVPPARGATGSTRSTPERPQVRRSTRPRLGSSAPSATPPSRSWKVRHRDGAGGHLQGVVHGVASQFGSRTVANCSPATGDDIRPQDDPLSMVNPKNVPKTCGKCIRAPTRTSRWGRSTWTRRTRSRDHLLDGDVLQVAHHRHHARPHRAHLPRHVRKNKRLAGAVIRILYPNRIIGE